MEESIRQVVIKAWSSRWSAAKFSMHCRKWTHNPECMDILADILLKEVLVGSTMNELLMSYFQHLLSSQAFTLKQTIICASMFEDTERPVVLHQLLVFFKKNSHLYFDHIEDNNLVAYTDLIFGHLNWLFNIMLKVMGKMSESDKSDPTGVYSNILSACCNVVSCITENPSYVLIMRLVRQVSLSECFQRVQECGEQLDILFPYLRDRRPDLVQRMTECINRCSMLDVSEDSILSQSSSFLLTSPTATISSLITLEALAYPTRPVKTVINYIKLYMSIQKLDVSVIIAEIVRACLSGLTESTCLDQLPVLLDNMYTHHQMFKTEELSAAIDEVRSYDSLLDFAAAALNDRDFFSVMINELVQRNLLPREYEMSLYAQEELQRHPNPSRIKPITTVKQRIDTVVNNLGRVTTGPDLIPSGGQLVGVLSQLIVSEDELNQILLAAAAAGKITKLLCHLIRVNDLSIQSSQNQLAVTLCDLTTIILSHAVNLFSAQVISDLLPDSLSNTVFMSSYMRSMRNASFIQPTQSQSDSLDDLLTRIIQKQPLAGCTKFSEMIMQLPLVFIELSKAWHLSGIDEQAIEQVISEVGAISHTLLLYPAIALVNQAKLSPSSLREKQVNIVNSIAQVTTDNSNKDAMLKAVISKVLDDVGLSQASQQKRLALTCTEPLTVSLFKTIEEVQRKGCITSAGYRQMRYGIKLAEPRWLAPQLNLLLFKCSYIEDIAKTSALLHMICHLELTELVDMLINEVIPSLLHKTAKPTSLAEPRSQAAVQLIVWSLAALLVRDEEKVSTMVQHHMDRIFTLMVDVSKTHNSQAIYIMQSLIHNVLQLGKPYSTNLLAYMPIQLISMLIPKETMLTDIILEKPNLSMDDVNMIGSSILRNQRRKKWVQNFES